MMSYSKQLADFSTELLAAFGIKNERVRAVDIHIEVDKPISITVEHTVINLNYVAGFMQKYEFIPAPVPPEEPVRIDVSKIPMLWQPIGRCVWCGDALTSGHRCKE